MIKSKVKEKKGCARILSVEVPYEEVVRVLDETTSEVLKVANIPGYRAGKAPKDLIKAHHGDKIKDEALKKLISDSYQELLSSMELTPISLPEVTDLKFHEEKPLTFDIKFEVKPQIKLKELSAISLTKKVYSIKDNDVEDRLNRIRESNAQFVSVSDRAIENLDYIIADVECMVDGKSEEKAQNIWLYVDKDGEDDIAKSLIGLKAGDETKANKKIGPDHPKENLREKDAEFIINIKEIKKKVLPELNEDFLKVMGQFKSIDELKERIKESIKLEYERLQVSDMKNQIVDAIDKSYDLNLPDSLVGKEQQRIKEQLRKKLLSNNIKEELINEKLTKVESQIEKDAIKNVKVYLILNEMADSYSIEVGKEELDKVIESIAASQRQSVTQFRDYLSKNDLYEDLKLQIRQDKIFDLILSKATTKEKNINSLNEINTSQAA